MFLICAVTSSDDMFKEISEIMGGISSQWVTVLPCLEAIGLAQV